MHPETPTDPEPTESSDSGEFENEEARKLPPLYSEESLADPQTDEEVRRWALELPRSLVVLLAIPISLLPRRWQEKHPLNEFPIAIGGIISGSFQFCAAMGLGFVLYLQYYADTVTGHHIGAIARNSVSQQPLQVMGMTVFLGFLFLTWKGPLVLFFAIEGMGRVVACASGQPFGTAPVAIVAKILDVAKRRATEAVAAANLVPDTVSADGDLMGIRIDSCRRRDWGKRDALSFEGQLFKLVSYRSEDDGLRRHRYFLEPIPAWFEPERTIDYTPELILNQQHKAEG